ncbi:MAG TPA: MgtC/SapB family protein [Methylococcaceae bacterium]|nr:MgtC/SapB family protein [Methylococcaceae bacterium]
MNPISIQALSAYWSSPQVEASILILMNMVGALLLGMLVGYERSYHGRAAGMRTYGLVCMASAGLTVIVGFPHYWFGGLSPLTAYADPTRVIQGIVTGIGFLGAGVIMKEGFNISGLTTAASIWASSAIGVLCGAGFYFAAIMLALLSASLMIWGGQIEGRLPSRHAATVILRFRKDTDPDETDIHRFAERLGFRVAAGSTSIALKEGQLEWRLVLIAQSSRGVSIPYLAQELRKLPFVENFQVAFARN